jgi:phosphoribosylanthranilate isomerase
LACSIAPAKLFWAEGGHQKMIVQIYSMTSIADATATAEAGADLIGVVVSEPGIVPEGIDAAAARAMLAAIRPRSRGVALSLADDRDEICAMVDIVQPDVVHVAAREIEPEDCAWIRRRIAPVRLLRAIAVRAGETLAEADAHQEVVDYLMLDSGAKGLAFVGASGETHDWSVAVDAKAVAALPFPARIRSRRGAYCCANLSLLRPSRASQRRIAPLT